MSDELKELKKELDKLKEQVSEKDEKIDTLIGEKRKATKKAADLEKEKDDAIKKAKEDKLKEEGKLEELHELKIAGMQSKLDAAEAKVVELTNGLDSLSKKNRKLIVDDGLKSKFMKVGVKNPLHLKAVLGLYANDAEIVEVDGADVVKIGGKLADDWIEEWSKDDGKAFISAGMSGGDAGPKSSGGAAESDYEQYFKPETLNLTKQNELRLKDSDAYDALKKKYPSKTNPLVAR